jgi:Ca2+-binding EF-hand superfamily protein
MVIAVGLAGSAFAQQAAKPAPSNPPAPPKAAGANGSGSPEQLFGQWDTDKSGQLSRKEFTEGWERSREESLIGRLEAQFRSLDVDRNGVLDATEYANMPMMKRAGPAGPPMSAFDADKSGKMDFREYLSLVQAMIKRSSTEAR